MTDHSHPARIAAETALGERARIERHIERRIAALRVTASGAHCTRAAEARVALRELEGLLADIDAGEHHASPQEGT